MATNQYFNNFYSTAEQTLHNNLIVESTKIYGIDMYYIPRTINDKDDIYTEDKTSTYSSAHLCEFYIKNIDQFGGMGDFLSKFNVEIRDSIVFVVPVTTFATNVATPASLIRPNEGDCLWFPLNKKMFQVKFVEHETIFYSHGKAPIYELQCELFEYSGELFETGISEIDDAMESRDFTVSGTALFTEDGLIVTDESGYSITLEEFDLEEALPESSNYEIEQTADVVINFTETDPFSQGNY